jgi:hypothetical protein
MTNVKPRQHGRELPKSPDFLTIGERKIASDGIQELLTEVTEAESLSTAVDSISKRIQQQGFRIPDKLLSLSPEAPRMGQVLSAHVLQPIYEGLPYISVDLKIFKPFDSESFSIQYRYQDPQTDPAMVEIETILTPGTDALDIGIVRRSRGYDEVTKWGSPIEEIDSMRPHEALGVMQAVSKDVLSALAEDRA